MVKIIIIKLILNYIAKTNINTGINYNLNLNFLENEEKVNYYLNDMNKYE